MVLKKILSKFAIPDNDWVLSRFGGCEPSAPSEACEEEPPASQAPTSVAARILNRLLDPTAADDPATPPQSGARVSSNASGEDPLPEPERKSRAS